MKTKKRLIDILLSSLALVAFFPVFLLIAAAIWLEDRGPVVFKQKRLGRNGQIFEVYKFRKFANRATISGSILTLEYDERYSRVGRFLEKTKLNELPQLLNVLRGHMSVVGPRPEIMDFRHCFSSRYSQLLEFTPGIFGPSQSAFRNEAAMYPSGQDAKSFYEQVLFKRKAELDLEYYPQATNFGDLYWIVRSLAATIKNEHGTSRGGLLSLPH